MAQETRPRRVAFIAGLAGLLLFATLILVAGCTLYSSRKDRAKETASITFGAMPGSVPLVYIAQDRGFFAANHLQVTVKEYPTGLATMGALSKGNLDIAWSTEFALVRRAFMGEDISIIASVGKFDSEFLLVRKDRGIRNVSDLRGKRIGVTQNTISEFYLGRFLELNGMSTREISAVDVSPAHFDDVVRDGSVDALVVWEPLAGEIRARQPGRMVAWPVQSSQSGYSVITGKQDWIRKHPELVARFLASLAQADEYLVHHPEAGKGIFQRYTHYDNDMVAACWPTYQMSLSLDESLILAMEDEARWMIKNNRTQRKAVPDYRNYMYLDALRAVKPEAVNVIR